MKDIFTFPTDAAGRAQRAKLAEDLRAVGREVREFDDVIAGFPVLRLEVGKRPDEGKIAADMKARRK